MMVVLLFVFTALIVSVYAGIPLLCPLLLGLLCFSLVSVRQGSSWHQVHRMILTGAKKSRPVVEVFALIGAITAVWRAAGTVSFIVYLGISSMNEQFFVLFAFLLCCMVSFVLGTSFGTVGTVGVVLAVLARSGGIDVNIVAGAIIAGAYFGDRCSPMSSSALLVAMITKTQLYANVANMLKATIVPLLLSIVGYAYLSYGHPLAFHDDRIANEIVQLFTLEPIVLAPAVIILLAAACRINLKISMGLSIAVGVLLALLVQHRSFLEICSYIITGYHIDSPGVFPGLIQGGGIVSMLNAGLIVIVSSAYAGIFDGTGMLSAIEGYIEKFSRCLGLFAATILTSIIAAGFGCNQTFATILTHQFEHRVYEKRGVSNERLALDLEDSVIVISPLIPWNIAGAFPAAILSVDSGFIAYSFYLFLLPLTALLMERANRRIA